jgi:putative transposase
MISSVIGGSPNQVVCRNPTLPANHRWPTASRSFATALLGRARSRLAPPCYTTPRDPTVLREHEAGAKTGELARKHGISEATLYNWKAKYGGLEVSEAKRLRTLEDENRKLKKLLAESMLDNAALKELLAKKW